MATTRVRGPGTHEAVKYGHRKGMEMVQGLVGNQFWLDNDACIWVCFECRNCDDSCDHRIEMKVG